MFVNCCKWEGKVVLIIDEVKRWKVFKDFWFLVGCFLFWNRMVSLYLINGLNLMDCLVFCDGVVVVCCIV